MKRDNDYYLYKYVMENIKRAVDGIEPSDFAMSFGTVREVWELKCILEKYEDEKDS